MVAEIAAVLLLARAIEPVYGSTEFLKLVLLVDFSCCLATFITVYLIYLASPNKEGGTL